MSNKKMGYNKINRWTTYYCFIINKSGQNKIMEYQCTNNKLNLNIYYSDIDLFVLNKEKFILTISQKILILSQIVFVII